MKLFEKISTITLGIALTLGAGLAIGSANTKLKVASAADVFVKLADADFTGKTTEGSYTDVYTYVENEATGGESWTVYGGNNNKKGWAYLRMGGKSLTKKDLYILSKAALTGTVTKVAVPGAKKSNANLTVNSVSLVVYSSYTNETTNTVYDTVTLTNVLANTEAADLEFLPSSGKTWSNMFFKLNYNLTNSTKSNYGVDTSMINFFETQTVLDPDTVSVNGPASASVGVATSFTGTATKGGSSTNVNPNVNWEVIDGTGHGVIDSTGKFIGLDAGTVTIKATSTTIDVSGTKEITVEAKADDHAINAAIGLLDENKNPLSGSYIDGYYTVDSVAYNLTQVCQSETGLQFRGNPKGSFENATKLSEIKLLEVAFDDTATGTDTFEVSVSSDASSWTVLEETELENGLYRYTPASGNYYFRIQRSSTSGTVYIPSIYVYFGNGEEDVVLDIASSLAAECQGSSDNSPVSAAKWLELSTAYNALTEYGKKVAKGEIDKGSYELKQFLERYDYCVSKLGLDNFMGRDLSSRNISSIASVNNNVAILIVVTSIISVSALGIFLLLKRKKRFVK